MWPEPYDQWTELSTSMCTFLVLSLYGEPFISDWNQKIEKKKKIPTVLDDRGGFLVLPFLLEVSSYYSVTPKHKTFMLVRFKIPYTLILSRSPILFAVLFLHFTCLINSICREISINKIFSFSTSYVSSKQHICQVSIT